MCRSIKQLRYADRSPTDEELQAAALQFVRKVSGYRSNHSAPSRLWLKPQPNTGDSRVKPTQTRRFN